MFTTVGVITTLVSCLGFWKLNESLNSKDLIIPVPEKYAGLTRYKWRNVFTSFIQASVISVIGPLCAYLTPRFLQDRVETHSSLGECMCAITIGYLIYDTRDLILHHGIASTWPLALHHIALIFIGLGTTLYQQTFIGYGIFCSFIEINSVFLHGRQLLLMYGFTKSSPVYKLNNFFNFATYLAFRLAIFTTFFSFIREDCNRVTPLTCSAFFLTASILLVINVVLFCRLIKSDFFYKSHKDDSDILVNNNMDSGKSD